MREVLTWAHAPRCPAVHAPLGANATVRGLPPPAAVRCALSRGDPPRYVLAAIDNSVTP